MRLWVRRRVRFLTDYFPVSEMDSRKLALFHSIRVGLYLWEHKYKCNVVIVRFLNDVLENTEAQPEEIKSKFDNGCLRWQKLARIIVRLLTQLNEQMTLCDGVLMLEGVRLSSSPLTPLIALCGIQAQTTKTRSSVAFVMREQSSASKIRR